MRSAKSFDRDELGSDHHRRDGIASQIVEGNRSIIGMMLESHLEEGRQDYTGSMESMRYGVTITDACISWETTEELIRATHEQLKTMG